MARYWLSHCDLGKALISTADFLCFPDDRKYNYNLTVKTPSAKQKSGKSYSIPTETILKNVTLDGIIMVRLNNIRCKIK